jgi:prephenate dehydrogenase
VPLTAEEHDRVLAKTSHLPHLLAYAYMSLIEEADINLAAGGLEDFTRIAGSNPDMWWEIFQLNRDDLLKSIRDFSRVLDKFDKAISEGDRDLVIDIMMSSATKRKNLN